jgi:hypothetical protein
LALGARPQYSVTTLVAVGAEARNVGKMDSVIETIERNFGLV